MSIKYNEPGISYNDSRFYYNGGKVVEVPVIPPPPAIPITNIKRVSPIMPAPVLDSEGRPG